jgi:D-inositol-3-phosphate glycosyltransferase
MTRRIAFISEHASPLGNLGGADGGGQNVYVAQLAKHLAALGYEVDVFTRRDRRDLPEIVNWIDRVRIINVDAGPVGFVRKEDMLPLMDEFREWMLKFFRHQEERYDLIHAHFFMSGLVAADIKRATGIPFVITFHALGKVRRLHQGGADGFSDERFMIEDRIVRAADQVIAECPQDEEDLIRLYDADVDRLTIVPAGFDPTEFWPMEKARARRKLGLKLAKDERVVLQLGRMVPRKGVDTALLGFAKLVREHGVRAKLIIVGGESRDPDPKVTPEIGRLMAIAESEGVSDCVIFTGSRRREELRYYYAAADVFISTPWYEPFGITPLEAMASGTPVIGSNVGGIKFSVRDGECGYLVPPRDPDAVAERLAFLFRHPKIVSVLRQQAIRRANDLFTWQRVASAMAAVYEQVLSQQWTGPWAAGSHQQVLPGQHLQHEVDQLAIIDNAFATASEVMLQAGKLLRNTIVEAAQAISNAFESGGKVLVCGNGGSAADAQHLVGELVGRFKYHDRQGLPAIALTADSAVLTAWGNDVSFDKVFARQVQALGRPGDVLIGISTSGRSRNVIEAFEAGRRQGLTCISLAGGNGGELLELSDISIVAPSSSTPRIQEVHIVALHLICELIDERMMAMPTAGVPLTWDVFSKV